MKTASPELASPRNRSTYERPEIVGRYRAAAELYPAESELLRRYRRQFSGCVLDIGIGAGRTTSSILQSCTHYCGVDISRSMIEAARLQFPLADLRVLDMREVPRELDGQQFDAILISFNSIDYISWDDRCILIKALAAMLAPAGVFVFSTHDLACAAGQRGFHLRADLRESLGTSYRPRSLVRLVLRGTPWMLKALRNRLRNRRMEKSYDGYAYVNDAAEDYGVLTVYVTSDTQRTILADSGFSKIEILQPWLQANATYFNYYACQR